MSDRPALDLHGATVAAGTARLRRWLADLAAAGAAEAEVITGWGRHTPQAHAPGALRRAVREVLRDERAVGRLLAWHELGPGRFYLRLAPSPPTRRPPTSPPLTPAEQEAAARDLEELGVRLTPETLAAWARRHRPSP